MKRIIGIVAVALALVTCMNAGAQGKMQESGQDKAQESGQDKVQDLNELIKECRRLESCGESRKAADAAIEYLKRGGTDSLEVAVDAMLKEMDYSEAVLRIKIGEETDPMNIFNLRSALVLLYDKTGNNEMELKEYLRIKWMLNGTGALAAYIAAIYYQLGMPADAVAELKSSEEDMLRTDPLTYHETLGINYQEAGRYAEAISEYSKAAELEPTEPFLYIGAGRCYELLGDIDKALEQYDSGISKTPGEPLLHLKRGKIFLSQGKTDLAEAEFKTVTEMDTVATDGSCRQFALHYLGKDKDALEWQNSVIAASPENPDVYFEKARLCSLAGFPDEAVSAMKTACEHGFNNFNIIERTDDLDNVRDIPAFKSLVETYSARHKAETERIRKEIRDLFKPSNQQSNQQS